MDGSDGAVGALEAELVARLDGWSAGSTEVVVDPARRVRIAVGRGARRVEIVVAMALVVLAPADALAAELARDIEAARFGQSRHRPTARRRGGGGDR